jgi:hypothetical protein
MKSQNFVTLAYELHHKQIKIIATCPDPANDSPNDNDHANVQLHNHFVEYCFFHRFKFSYSILSTPTQLLYWQ